MRPSWFMLFFFMVFLFLGGCEIFSDHNSNNQFPLPPKEPLLDFSYTNSNSFSGWVRFQNHSYSIVSYKWYLGFNDAEGNEVISFSPAPKVQYPANGVYHVMVKGVDIYDKMHSLAISVEVSNTGKKTEKLN